MKNINNLILFVIFLGFIYKTPVFAVQNGSSLSESDVKQGLSPVVKLASADRGVIVSNCTGVVLNSKVILTAAHCFYDYNKMAVRKISIQHLETNRIHQSSFKMLSMPGYQSSFHDFPEFNRIGFDLGVIILSREIPFALQTVNLNTSNGSLVNNNLNLFLIGAGDHPPFFNTSSSLLPIKSVWFWQPQDLAGFYEFISKKEDAGICDGDSGSGVFYTENNQLILVGIESSANGANCGAKNSVGYFVPVRENLIWIQEILDNVALSK